MPSRPDEVPAEQQPPTEVLPDEAQYVPVMPAPSAPVYSTTDLLEVLSQLPWSTTRHDPPWGIMKELSAPSLDFTVKHIQVFSGHRTSLQVHEKKHEVIIILSGSYDTGFVETGALTGELQRCNSNIISISPGMLHRVTGSLEYLEISTYSPDDTVRIQDDYGRILSWDHSAARQRRS
jgi:mannose-6-phosphate isomerase-like protein (cupin superfamily)